MYTNLETAYNDNTQDLDKMAKELNKKKDNLFVSQETEFDRVEKKWKKDITSYNNYMNYKDPETNEQYATFNNNNLDI